MTEAQAAFGWIWPSVIVVTRSPGGGQDEMSSGRFLGGDRGRYGRVRMLRSEPVCRRL